MTRPLRVAVLGYGTIGTVVADRLALGAVPGACLTAIVNRSPAVDAPAPCLPFGDALSVADVVVECAGQEALREHGPEVVDAGRALVVSSIGALADPGLCRRLQSGPGRLVLTPGAVGGLDLLTAACEAAPFDGVRVRTTKRPEALVQPWMPAHRRDDLLAATAPTAIFAGGPDEAARLFPASLNVAATVALAVGSWQIVQVELYADPAADLTKHEIEAWGPVGHYSWTIENLPSPHNPRTSAVVPYALLRSVACLTTSPPLIA